MRATVRRSTLVDAGAISRIAAAALASTIDVESPRVRRFLSQGRALVATSGEEALGFADGFITLDDAGRRRYELDLLAVAPNAQGHGIGSALVAACVSAATARHADEIRALVRTSNAGMARILQRHGFRPSLQVHTLHVGQPGKAPATARPHEAHLIAVDTLTYSGIWLEGKLTQAALDVASRQLANAGGIVGAVFPSRDASTIELLRANGFDHAGEFHWWSLSL